ncbi:MAG TPA: ATPase, T2SS/T4P/T4SS family, partial [Acidobacteriota bacterium]|nr:ATPase, T2SS/T4P/T4SS family [Acidobacteriota bacterium]
MAKIDRYFLKLKELSASDLHVAAGTVPKFRVHGSLEPMSGEPEFTDANLKEILFEILNEQQKNRFLKTHDLDFAYSLEGTARFRCNYMLQRQGIAAVFRMIPEKIKTIEELMLPQTVEKFAHLHQGLVLVTGPTGSGKSTTLAAIIDAINTVYTKHILTIEDPIEFVHENKKCLVTQREVGQDTRDFAGALRAAGREDADVILVGEMR